MRRGSLAAALLLLGCHHAAPAGQGDTSGDRLERAAMAGGVVADPAADPGGAYGSETDRLCLRPESAGRYRIGAAVLYDDRQGCLARGEAERSGGRLAVRLGDDCRFDARAEGDRVSFPAELPAGCQRYCTGRASLSALAVERWSSGTAEATRASDGAPLCG